LGGVRGPEVPRTMLLSPQLRDIYSRFFPVPRNIQLINNESSDLTADTVVSVGQAGQGPRLSQISFAKPLRVALQQTSPNRSLLHISHSLPCRGPWLVGSWSDSLGSCELLAILAEYLGATTQAERRKDRTVKA
jgi:hypothetical protein